MRMATAHVRSERDHIFGNQPKDITKIHTRNPKGLAEIHNQRLVEYITSGRLYKLRLMLEDEESELNVNCIDENQMTPLMVACSLDKEKGKTRDYIIRMLLKRGANPNIVDANGMTVLANACKQNNLGVVRILLNKASVDIDFNMKDHYGDTCLMHAVRTSNTELVRLLVNTMQRLSIDIDVKNNTDITPYLEAKRFGFNEVANVLTQDGNACQSIMICPLIFDEYREDAYNEIDATRRRSDISSNEELKLKKLNQKCSKRTVISRNRLIKSAQEKKSDTGEPKERGTEMKGKHSNNKIIHQTQRERSRSELESTNEVLHNEVLHVNESNVDNFKNHENKKDNEHTEQNSSLIPVNHESQIEDDCNRENNTEVEKNGLNQKEATTRSEKRADSGATGVKGTWLRRLQKRAPTWKRRLLGSEVGGENHQEDKHAEMYRPSTLSSGTMGKLSPEGPSTPLVHRRCSSNLSVYFSGSHHSIPLNRPISANVIQGKHEDFIQDSYKQSVLQEPARPCITYEEVFTLCPEMKGDINRTWYSDIRWMLALKAHQNSTTYLPAQQQRYCHDSVGSDFRNDSEGSRASRRPSIYDLKRPVLKKRHTTISSSGLKKFNED